MVTVSQTQRTLNEAWTALGGDHDRLGSVAFSHDGELRSVYPVDDLASAMVGCAGMAIAELIEHHAGERPNVIVDRRLTSLWFDSTVRPIGWTASAVGRHLRQLSSQRWLDQSTCISSQALCGGATCPWDEQ